MSDDRSYSPRNSTRRPDLDITASGNIAPNDEAIISSQETDDGSEDEFQPDGLSESDSDSNITLDSSAELHSLVTLPSKLDSKNLTCSVCNSLFSSLASLKLHIRSHTGEKPHQCTHCDLAFSRPYSLRRHLLTHSEREKRFKCKTCGKTFNHRNNFVAHERIHSGEKPFQCCYCEKSFARDVNRKRHEMVHTGEKPIKCNSCEQTFRQIGHLKSHERVHMATADHKCPHCTKFYTTPWDLKKHVKTHLNFRPFQCKVCLRAFGSTGHLKKHEMIHTDERPFACSVCDKFFRSSGCVRKHEETHTREKSRTPSKIRPGNSIDPSETMADTTVFEIPQSLEGKFVTIGDTSVWVPAVFKSEVPLPVETENGYD